MGEQILPTPGAKFTGDPYNPPPPPFPEYAQRLSVETQETVVRLVNLSGYIETKSFKELPVFKQHLLVKQKSEMEEYAKSLSLRYCMALLEHG